MTLAVFHELIYAPRLVDCQQNVPVPSNVNGAVMLEDTGLHGTPVIGVGVRVGVFVTAGVLVRVGIRVMVGVGPVAVRVGVRVMVGESVTVAVGCPVATSVK